MEALTEGVVFEKYPAYKDSGAEWLGKVPEHWDFTKVKFQITYQKGKNPKRITLDDGDCVYLSMDYLRGNSQKIQYVENTKGLIEVCDDDILLLWDGANAGEFIRAKKGVLSSTMALISVINANINFSWYFFKVLEIQLRNSTNGMGIPHVSSSEFTNFLFPIPPLSEQKQIANFLKTKTAQIDLTVAQKEKQIELLKERRQVLIHKAVTRGLNPDVPLKDSGMEYLNVIPTHWETTKFKFIIRTKARLGWKGLKAHEYVDESEYGFLSTPNIKNGDIDFKGAYFITERRYYESPEIMLVKDDVLLVKDGSTLGIVNIVKTLPFHCTVNSSIAVLRVTRTEKLNANYLLYFLKSDYSQKVIDLKKDGMGVPHLFQSDINNFICLLPTVEEQKEIVAYINSMTRKIATAISCKEKEIEKLKEYKATLINSAVTGKIKVC